MKHYFSLPITKDISLVQPSIKMAKPLFELVDSDRKHLEEYLEFVKRTKTVADEEKFLKLSLINESNGTDKLFFIYFKGQLAGTIDLHFIDDYHKRAEIGYWIHSNFTGKGITTLAVQKVCEVAFEDLELNKLTIAADSQNIGSNKVAQKAGFQLIATFKEDHMLYGELRDVNRYYLLKSDFMAKK